MITWNSYGHTRRRVDRTGVGAISGGAFKNNSNLLGRKREQDELEKKVKTHLPRQSKLWCRKLNLQKKGVVVLRKDLEELKRDLGEFIEQKHCQIKCDPGTGEKKKEAAVGFETLKMKEEIDQNITWNYWSEEFYHDRIGSVPDFGKGNRDHYFGITGKLEVERSKETEQTTKTGELDVEVEKKLRKQEFHQQNLNRIQGEILRLTSELDEILQKQKELTEEIGHKEENIIMIEQTIKESSPPIRMVHKSSI